MSKNALIPYIEDGDLPKIPVEILGEDNDLSGMNKDKMMEFLPDLLGKALALCWVNDKFKFYLEKSPQETLAQYGVRLPPDFSIDFTYSETGRPQITVFEFSEDIRFRKRIFDLKLVLMAAK